MNKNLKHLLCIMLLIGFIVLALGSMGSTPSSSQGNTKCVMCDGYGTINSAFPGEPNKWVVCPECKGKGFF